MAPAPRNQLASLNAVKRRGIRSGMAEKKGFPLLAVALDVTSLTEVREIVSRLPVGEVVFKVGKQLFVAQGPEAVRAIQSAGGRCLLDLKFYDIPHTVEMAVAEATRLGVWGMTLHALGGRRMLEAAKEAARKTAREKGVSVPYLFAVTIPTSMDASTLKEVGITTPLEVSVLHLADLAIRSGIDGVVASPLEATILRKALGPRFLIMTPGIRISEYPGDDQRRVASPTKALDAGADLLVMGRSILNTPNPEQTTRDILALLKNFSS